MKFFESLESNFLKSLIASAKRNGGNAMGPVWRWGTELFAGIGWRWVEIVRVSMAGKVDQDEMATMWKNELSAVNISALEALGIGQQTADGIIRELWGTLLEALTTTLSEVNPTPPEQ